MIFLVPKELSGLKIIVSAGASQEKNRSGKIF